MLYVPAPATPGLNVAIPQSVVVKQPAQAGEIDHVERPEIVPGGKLMLRQFPSSTHVPDDNTVPLDTSMMVYGMLAAVVLLSQSWIWLVWEGDMVEIWISLLALLVIGTAQPPGPAQAWNTLFAYQLI